MKWRCQYYFVEKWVYVDTSLYELQYHYWDHVTVDERPTYGVAYDESQHALGGRLSKKTIDWIETYIRQGFTYRQVMWLHQQKIMEAARLGIKPTRDTFIMPLDVQNVAKKRAREIWEKHPNDALSIRM
jgi:hypothetical protein